MKTLHIKCYNSDNVYIKTVTDFDVTRFNKRINSGMGEMVIKLARKFDAFNTAGDMSLGNRLELYVVDVDSNNELLVYTGYIEQQSPKIEGNEEKVEILCLGIVTRLSMDILRSGSQTTLYTLSGGLTTTVGSLAAAEVADVIKAIIALFKTSNPDVPLDYETDAGDTVEDTGQNVTYVFEALRYSDALEKCRQSSPANWYWFVNAMGVLSFRVPSSEPDHIFEIGKNISNIQVTRGLDSVKNIVLVWNGTDYKIYEDNASKEVYGRRILQIIDQNIGDTDTMDNVGNAAVQENKDPRIRIVMEVIDNNENNKGYDIESIEVGHTCSIRGVNPDESLFTEAMIIREVIWSVSKATLILETRKAFNTDDVLKNLRKEFENEQRLGIPESYT